MLSGKALKSLRDALNDGTVDEIEDLLDELELDDDRILDVVLDVIQTIPPETVIYMINDDWDSNESTTLYDAFLNRRTDILNSSIKAGWKPSAEYLVSCHDVLKCSTETELIEIGTEWLNLVSPVQPPAAPEVQPPAAPEVQPPATIEVK